MRLSSTPVRALVRLCSIISLFSLAHCGGALPASTVKDSGQKATPVDDHGWLRVEGRELKDASGQLTALHGMSSHGLAWFPRFVNESALRWLANDWNIDIFRIAMIVDHGYGGYVDDQSQKELVIRNVDAAVKLGLYVIIDWHILFDGDPNAYRAQSKQFFREMAERYGRTPNVIFEICNEPNGANVTWKNQIKPYAEEIIPVIRAAAPHNLILVGTGNWSQDVQDAAAAPLSFDNVLYVAHFYAGSHKQWLRDRIDAAREKNLPIFISEMGSSNADGDGGPFFDEFATWLEFANSRRLSWINWSVADKQEASAALRPGANPYGYWGEQDLTASGHYSRQALRDFKAPRAGR